MKIRRCFHDLGDLFNEHLGCCRSTWAEEPVSHLFLQAEAPELCEVARGPVLF